MNGIMTLMNRTSPCLLEPPPPCNVSTGDQMTPLWLLIIAAVFVLILLAIIVMRLILGPLEDDWHGG